MSFQCSRRLFVSAVIGACIGATSMPKQEYSWAEEQNLDNPCNLQVDTQCAVRLIEEFKSTSFSTTSVIGGTNYSLLFSTYVPRSETTPGIATGYRIESVAISGVDKAGKQFIVTPAIGEQGLRLFDTIAASSLGFVLEHSWKASELIRTLAYTYNIIYVRNSDPVQICRYVTAMHLADNGLVLGGIGSVHFSPPQLVRCDF